MSDSQRPRRQTLLRRLFTPSFILVVLVAIIASAGISMVEARSRSSVTAADMPADDNGEPPGAQRATPPEPLADGVTSGGIGWKAVRYNSRRGDVCIDVVAATDSAPNSVAGSVGGCFAPSSPETQSIRFTTTAINDSLVVGLLDHSSGLEGGKVGPGRAVTVSFDTGDTTTVKASADGLFVATGKGTPLRLSYTSSSGERWDHPVGSESHLTNLPNTGG